MCIAKKVSYRFLRMIGIESGINRHIKIVALPCVSAVRQLCSITHIPKHQLASMAQEIQRTMYSNRLLPCFSPIPFY